MSSEQLSDNEALVERYARAAYSVASVGAEWSEEGLTCQRMKHQMRAHLVADGVVKLLPPPPEKTVGERIAEEFPLTYTAAWGGGELSAAIDAALAERTEECAKIVEGMHTDYVTDFRALAVAAIRKLGSGK